MDNLISRQAAIDVVRAYLSDCCVEDGDYHADGIEYELNDLPSAQPEPRWIPVTERLPEEDGTYIVCLDDESVFEYDYISKWWDDGAWQYCGKDVVAWMPLPDPWKGGEE